MIKYSIVGASGYVGGELLRIAAGHSELELHLAAAHSNADQEIGTVHPHLISLSRRKFDPIDIERLRQSDVVFLALPHGKSAEIASQLSANQMIVDAGADYRLIRPTDWAAYYETPHAGTWPYGLPELTLASGGKQRGRLRETKRIAAPGCNVSAVTLALAPGYTAQLLDPESSSVLAVGTSGAGRSLRANLLAAEVLGSATAYGVAGSHRHNPEIIQNLELAGASSPVATFTPVLVPLSRGILSVTHVKLRAGVTADQLREAYESAYGDEFFVNLLPIGLQPTIGSVVGSNFAQIGIEVDDRTQVATITVAIDNLVKGTAGAAIQSMNIALGLPEVTGLQQIGVAP